MAVYYKEQGTTKQADYNGDKKKSWPRPRGKSMAKNHVHLFLKNRKNEQTKKIYQDKIKKISVKKSTIKSKKSRTDFATLWQWPSLDYQLLLRVSR